MAYRQQAHFIILAGVPTDQHGQGLVIEGEYTRVPATGSKPAETADRRQRRQSRRRRWFGF